MSDFSERDGQLLALFGMTEEQVREAEMIADPRPSRMVSWGRSITGVTILMLLGLVHDGIFL